MTIANHDSFKINKAVGLPLKADADIDITSIRVGKQRLARKRNTRLSSLKEAIISHRAAPAVETEDLVQSQPTELLHADSSHPDPQSDESWVLAEKILKELTRLQTKGLDQPPEKRYKYKKFVVGLREVQRSLNRNLIVGVVLAVNLEPGVDELDYVVNKIVSDCESKGIPVIRALTRRKLSKCVNKSMKQSLVGIVSLEGVHQDWKKLLSIHGSVN